MNTQENIRSAKLGHANMKVMLADVVEGGRFKLCSTIVGVGSNPTHDKGFLFPSPQQLFCFATLFRELDFHIVLGIGFK